MKIRTEITPSRHLWLPAVALSFGLMLLAWSAGHAYGEGGSSNPNPTTTALDCSPASAEVGQSVHCTATVSGVIGADSGEVVFKSENAGKLSARSCELSFAAKGAPASCSIDYVPAADGSAQQRLHAIYLGDEANEFSEAIFALTILGGGDGGGEEEAGGGEEKAGGGEEGSGEEKGGGEDEGGGGGKGDGGDGGGKDTSRHTKAKTHRRAHRRCHCGSARNGARTSKRG